MDFETRDRYRKVIEHLAWATGVPEEVVARQAVDLALDDNRRRAEGRKPMTPDRPRSHLRPTSWPLGSRRPADRHGAPEGDSEPDSATLFGERTGHIGFYLLDHGLQALEGSLGYAPPAGERLRRWLEVHALWGYLGSIVLLTGLGLGALAALTSAWGGTGLQIGLALLLGLIPAVSVAVGLVHSIVPRLVSPRLLLKMEFQEGIPSECTTLVAIPALLTNAYEIQALLRQLEQHYLSTLDDNLLFALLTDFADAPQEQMPGDEALLAQAREGVRQLNLKHGEGRSTPFHLLHRKREWNASEGVWMGWERKRGKLVELNRWLSGEPSSSYALTDPGVPLPAIRYVITLDADSLLTRGGARRLIATLAHPLNQAAFDPDTGALIAGYTVLQPRVRVKPASVNRSLLTRLFAGDRGLDLYTQAVSDVYQDLFQEGIYVGKGIMDVAAFHRSLEGRVPENALLSHDLFEGIVGRAGLVADVVVLENYPDHYLASVERQHRWMRGDWQLLPWLMPWVPSETGSLIPSDFSSLDRWKILDNLRRSLLAPSILALLIAGWLWLPGPILFWTLVGVLTPGASILAGLALGIRLPPSVVRAAAPAVDGPGALGAVAHPAALRSPAVSRRHRRDAGAPAAHPPAAAGVDAGGAVQPRPGQARLARADLEAHDLGADRGAGFGAVAGAAATFVAGAGCTAARRLVRLASDRTVDQPPDPPAPGAAHAGAAAAAGGDRPPHVAVLRALRRAGGPLAAAGSLSGVAPRPGGASHFADQHRFPAALGRGRRAIWVTSACSAWRCG